MSRPSTPRHSRTPQSRSRRKPAPSRAWLGWLFKLGLVGTVLLAGLMVYFDAVVQEKFHDSPILQKSPVEIQQRTHQIASAGESGKGQQQKRTFQRQK